MVELQVNVHLLVGGTVEGPGSRAGDAAGGLNLTGKEHQLGNLVSHPFLPELVHPDILGRDGYKYEFSQLVFFRVGGHLAALVARHGRGAHLLQQLHGIGAHEQGDHDERDAAQAADGQPRRPHAAPVLHVVAAPFASPPHRPPPVAKILTANKMPQ